MESLGREIRLIDVKVSAIGMLLQTELGINDLADIITEESEIAVTLREVDGVADDLFWLRDEMNEADAKGMQGLRDMTKDIVELLGHRKPPHRTGDHLTAPEGTAPHRRAPHRTGEQGIC